VKENMILAQLSISPLGVGISVSRYVKKVVKILENEPVICYTNAMATVIEAETTEQIFTAVKHAHDALIKEPGTRRVITELKIDHQTDKDATAKSKINAVR
jgi:uncharacterized protein (TIGR00106 family)